jgi:hypothetical protein
MVSYGDFAQLEKRGWTDDNITTGYMELLSSASDLAIPAILSAVMPNARVYLVSTIWTELLN